MEIYFHLKDEEFDKFDIKFYKVNSKSNKKELIFDSNLSKPRKYKSKSDTKIKSKLDKIIDKTSNKKYCVACDCYIVNFKQHAKSKKHRTKAIK